MADYERANAVARSRTAPTIGRILLVDDDDLVRESVTRILSRAGHEVTPVSAPAKALETLRRAEFDLLLTDLKMPGMTGVELLIAAREMRADLPVVLMTAYASVRTAVEAMRRGAYDYIQKPFEREDLLLLVERTLAHAGLQRENRVLREAAGLDQPVRPLVGSSRTMCQLRETIARIASSEAGVLIRGESGTGKEAIARLIHGRSSRHAKPLLAVNCAALSETLLESELFGHEKGAFTGADKLRRGRFELADGGTLLLDEVSEITLSLQAKLLRMLQERCFERVGGSATLHVDVRVIATSNRNLEEAVACGRFREDLYYRLNVVPLEVPPLRERREDIPELVRHFLHRIAKREGQPFRHIEPEALRLLQKFTWPGNVRELQNIIERAAMLETEPGLVRASTIAPWLQTAIETRSGSDPLDSLPLAEVEKRVILETLAKFEGHRAKTAGALGIGLRTLGIKLKKWREDGEIAELPFV